VGRRGRARDPLIPPLRNAAGTAPAYHPRVDTSRDLVRDPAAWVAIACAIGFLLVSVVVNGQGHIGLDAPASSFVKSLPVPTDAWALLTAAGGIVLVPIGVLLVVGLILVGQIRMAIVVAAALILAAVSTELVKLLIARPRPPGEPLIGAPGYSFPSGHTLNSTVTYGLVALVAWRSRLPIAVRRILVAGLVVLIVLVGLSRIALGVHYPSDVLAGWLAGTAIVATVVVLTREPVADRPPDGPPAGRPEG
jgi:membrane-associated phospholipid phosphatase